ncbi:MAG: hypothetical protein R3Y36_05850 [Spirochaetales bacterium]
MKLTKTQFGKAVSILAFIAISMTGPVFASASKEADTHVATSPVITANETWVGMIDGMAVNMHYDANSKAIVGTVKNMLQNDLSNASVTISILQKSNNPSAITTLPLGVPGNIEVDDIMIKENTIVFSPRSSVPVAVYLSPRQEASLLSGGWQVSLTADNAPKYGLLENGALIATEGLFLSTSFSSNTNGVQTIVEYDVDDDAFYGTLTNYTNKPVNNIKTTVYLDNGAALSCGNAVSLQPGETVSLTFDTSSQSGYNYYATVTKL